MSLLHKIKNSLEEKKSYYLEKIKKECFNVEKEKKKTNVEGGGANG